MVEQGGLVAAPGATHRRGCGRPRDHAEADFCKQENGRRDEGAVHGGDDGNPSGRASVSAEDQRKHATGAQQEATTTSMAGRKEERKEERRSEGEVVRRSEKEEVDEKGGQQVVVEDVTEWVELKRKIRRGTTQGKHEEEGSINCQSVQIFVKVERSKAFPLGMSLSDKVSDIVGRIPNSASCSKRDVCVTCGLKRPLRGQLDQNDTGQWESDRSRVIQGYDNEEVIWIMTRRVWDR